MGDQKHGDPTRTSLPGEIPALDYEAIALLEDRMIAAEQVLERAVAAAAAAVEKLRVLRYMLADLRHVTPK